MDKCAIDINKLTAEAESGRGDLIEEALDKLSFAQRTVLLREMEYRNQQTHQKSYPKLEFEVSTSYPYDCDSKVTIELDRTAPVKDVWGYVFTPKNCLYSDTVHFSDGSEGFTITTLKASSAG